MNEFSFDPTTTNLMPHVAGIFTRTKCAWSFPGFISFLAFWRILHSLFIGKLEDIISSSNSPFIKAAPNMTPGKCSYGGEAWVAESCMDDKGRTLVIVRYALANTMETINIQLTRITLVPILQHACTHPPKEQSLLYN
jgi:hypothetical protein